MPTRASSALHRRQCYECKTHSRVSPNPLHVVWTTAYNGTSVTPFEGLRFSRENYFINVSVEEWVSMWNDYAQNPSAALQWQQLYCQFMFQLEDASADGAIDCDEFTSVCSAYGIDPHECNMAFTKMAKGKASVSWEMFQELWKEFFATEDPNAPGNFIFGRTSF